MITAKECVEHATAYGSKTLDAKQIENLLIGFAKHHFDIAISKCESIEDEVPFKAIDKYTLKKLRKEII